ncbi:hypothetical protein LQE92_06765 [Lacrimispora sp. NSJ-141]|uniref:Uncharacterized protein n=1 Tax=Lientehia hominis TaxID=2897778 RepID=A0AAP2RHN6_9FIRM|nr:hypothetical protein [Lientehia hominis]MCD2492332.1 hypothetical protein [Lientehia hominis]
MTDISRDISDSDFILIGIGEEWESREMTEELRAAYEKLRKQIENRDYFIVTTVMDGWIHQMGFDDKRIVAPCGNWNYLQCKDACCPDIWMKGDGIGEVCPECGASLVENTVESKPYVETGYLSGWQTYMSWLQKSLNRKLLLMELGVGFRTPTVVRWPFEKTAYLNLKSRLYRVHEKLFQIPDNLEGRGISVPLNSVEWTLSALTVRQ